MVSQNQRTEIQTESDMSEAPEPRAARMVRQQEVTTVTQRVDAADGLAPEAAPLEHHTDQVVQSAAGVERRERVITDAAGLQHRERNVTDQAAEHRFKFQQIAQVIWIIFGGIEALIGLRVLLKLIGANPDNGFAQFVYSFAGIFLAPFLGLTGTPTSGGMVLEIPSILALLLYGALGWVIVRKILPMFDAPTTRTGSTFDHYRA